MNKIDEYTYLEKVALLMIGMVILSIRYWYFTLIGLFYFITVIIGL